MTFEEKIGELEELLENQDENAFHELEEFVYENEKKVKDHSFYCGNILHNAMLASFLDSGENKEFEFLQDNIPYLYFIYACELLNKNEELKAKEYLEKAVSIDIFNFDYYVALMNLNNLLKNHEGVMVALEGMYTSASDAMMLASYYASLGEYMKQNKDYHFALCVLQYSEKINYMDAVERSINEIIKDGGKRPTEKELQSFLKRGIVEPNGSFYAISGHYICSDWLMDDGDYQAAYNCIKEIKGILGNKANHIKEYEDTLKNIKEEALKAGVNIIDMEDEVQHMMIENIPDEVYLCTTDLKNTKVKDLYENEVLYLELNNEEIDVITYKDEIIGKVPKKNIEIILNLMKAGFKMKGIVDSIKDNKITIRIYMIVRDEEETKEQVYQS